MVEMLTKIILARCVLLHCFFACFVSLYGYDSFNLTAAGKG
jgi:hypothetical protein